MKKNLTTLLVLILLSAFLLSACQTNNVAAPGCLGSANKALVDLNCEEITIAVENAYLPFNYISAKTGKPSGWDYETWAEICTRLNCAPVFVESAWDGMIQSVAQGQYDAAGDGITITEERMQQVDFSIGYIQINQRLLVRIGETRFSSIEDLAADSSLILGTQLNTSNYETAKQYLSEDRIKGFEQFPFAVQALISGRCGRCHHRRDRWYGLPGHQRRQAGAGRTYHLGRRARFHLSQGQCFESRGGPGTASHDG